MFKLFPCSGVLLLCLLLFSGCDFNTGETIIPSSPPALSEPTGGVVIRTSLSSAGLSATPVSKVEAVLSRGDREIRELLVMNAARTQATGVFKDVVIGTWQLTVYVYDETESLLFTGTGEVLVEEEKTTSAAVALKPAPGAFLLYMSLGEFGTYDGVVKGKVLFRPGDLVETFEREGTEQMVCVEIDGLVPRTYDVCVELYQDTLHTYNRVYQGPWKLITIAPGQTTEAHWSPALGQIEVIGEVDDLPPAPTGVAATAQPDGIAVSWQPVETPENDLAGYNIYVRTDVSTGFQLVGQVAADTTSYLYWPEVQEGSGDSGSGSAAMIVEIAVSALDTAGNESWRSPLVTVEW